jgi:hypothetical protein
MVSSRVPRAASQAVSVVTGGEDESAALVKRPSWIAVGVVAVSGASAKTPVAGRAAIAPVVTGPLAGVAVLTIADSSMSRSSP